VADLLEEYLRHVQRPESERNPPAALRLRADTDPRENAMESKRAEQLQRQNRWLKGMLIIAGLLLLLGIGAAGLVIGLRVNQDNRPGEKKVAGGGSGTAKTDGAKGNPSGKHERENRKPKKVEGQPARDGAGRRADGGKPAGPVTREDLFGKWRDEDADRTYARLVHFSPHYAAGAKALSRRSRRPSGSFAKA
jgi:hypothetical protein